MVDLRLPTNLSTQSLVQISELKIDMPYYQISVNIIEQSQIIEAFGYLAITVILLM